MTIGQTIGAAREAQGLSIDDLSEKTRIRPALLSSIEANDFAACGGDTYARGHIRSIATALGLEAADLLDQFGAQGGTPAHVSATVAPIEQPTRIMESANRSDGLRQLAGSLGIQDARGGRIWLPLLAILGIVLAGVGLFFFFTHRSSSSPAALPSTTPSSVTGSTSSPAPTLSNSPTPTPSESPSTMPPSESPSSNVLVTDSGTPDASTSAPVVPTSGTSVQVTVTGAAAWVSAAKGKGGEKIFEGLLTSGDTKVFMSDTTVYLVVGDAGAVTLKVNGYDLGVAGTAGQVVRTEYGPGNPNQ
jgi:cytoskeleton protein RodZ